MKCYFFLSLKLYFYSSSSTVFHFNIISFIILSYNKNMSIVFYLKYFFGIQFLLLLLVVTIGENKANIYSSVAFDSL